jgi:hypothetical protein
VLVSETTRALAADAEFRDLGAHRLKDLEGETRLHQLVVAGLPAEFDPPRTEARALPLAVDRAEEITRQAEAAAERLRADIAASVEESLRGIPAVDASPWSGPPSLPRRPPPERVSLFSRLFRRGRR